MAESRHRQPALAMVVISEGQAKSVADIEEGQFSDVKATGITPGKLTKTISAFANTDGGDLYVGVAERHLGGGVKLREWDGFTDVEGANGHLQSLEGRFPLGADIHYEFLRCDTRPGVVLHIQVARSKSVFRADDGIPYVRRGAQNLPVGGPEGLRRLAVC